MIIGTAGHIDHGKTTLVRALTGVDTDRLPEEKARGISIDLGYAYAPLASGQILGFVDVPGHEKFVHTMLAGATGIDFALLVVAADDGVMPQTREHLDIVALLGVGDGAVALTKTDVVDPTRVDAVAAEVRTLTSETPFADAPIFRVSARTGSGVDDLRIFLEARAAAHHRPPDGRHFRLAVDRSFTLPGIGTVVTGTVHSGEVCVGDDIVVAPEGRPTRARSIHAQNRPSERGFAGQRCALNLAGVARDQVARGDWIVAPPVALSTSRVDAEMTVLGDAPRPLRTGTTLQIHLGTTEVSGRLVMLGKRDHRDTHPDEIVPGENAIVQLIVHRSIAAWHGDRFIVRDPSMARTVAGGRVLDPFAPSRHRSSPDRLAILAALEIREPKSQLEALLERSVHGIDLARFARANFIREVDAVASAVPGRRVTSGEADCLVNSSQWRSLGERVLIALKTFHEAQPDELGPDAGRLKRIAFPRLDAALYRGLISELIKNGEIRRAGPWLHLPTHHNAPSAQERALVDRILPRLLDSPFDPPWLRDLAKDLKQPESLVRTALIRASKRGEMFQVVRDLFYHPKAVRALADAANSLQSVSGEVRAAAFRDRTKLGRKRAIQILEFFDRIGFTRRVREAHLVRADSLLAVGDPAIAADERRSSKMSQPQL